jgi:hypothetical protein
LITIYFCGESFQTVSLAGIKPILKGRMLEKLYRMPVFLAGLSQNDGIKPLLQVRRETILSLKGLSTIGYLQISF